MGSITPPPSPTEEPQPMPPPPRSSPMTPVIFGAVFIVFSALIFTLTIHPPNQSAPAPPPAAPVVSKQPQPAIPPPALPLTYPTTRTTADSDIYFGVKVADPYRWLEDGNSPEVKQWF